MLLHALNRADGQQGEDLVNCDAGGARQQQAINVDLRDRLWG